MASNDAESRWEFGEAGVCDAVVEIMKTFGWSKSAVQEAASGAVWSLAADSTLNADRLGDAGACECLIEVLRSLGGDSADVAEAVRCTPYAYW